MGLRPDPEFDYPVRGWYVAALATASVVSLGVSVLVVVVLGVLWYRTIPVQSARAPLWAWVLPVAYGLGAAGCAWGIVHHVLLARRAGVLVTRVGLLVRDWRGREQRLFWDQLLELRVIAWLSGVRPPYGLLELRTAADQVRIPSGLVRRDWEDLRDLVIRHAGLTETTRKWWGVTYRRPAT